MRKHHTLTCTPRVTRSKGVVKRFNNEKTFNALVPHYFCNWSKCFHFSPRSNIITTGRPRLQRLPLLFHVRQAEVSSNQTTQHIKPTHMKFKMHFSNFHFYYHHLEYWTNLNLRALTLQIQSTPQYQKPTPLIHNSYYHNILILITK